MAHAPQPAFLELPVEARTQIFDLLDNEALLTSRVVCKDWRRFVDDVMMDETKIIWKPYFARHRTAEVLLIFGFTLAGSRFSSAEEVYQFMEDHPENEDPFINHTLIINSNTIGEHTGLCRVFPRLVARFGKFVQHCVYYVHEKVPGSVRHISTIFQMTNLRSLTIYCADWSWNVNLENLDIDNNDGQTLRDFESLTVLGDSSYVFLQRIAPAYGSQIKRLHYCGRFGNEPQLATFPNLKELKVSEVTGNTLPTICSNRWPLKRLSMKMYPNKHDKTCLKNVLESINVYAGTLESFHLQGKKRQFLDGSHFYLQNSTLQFPKVTDLRVPYFLNSPYEIGLISRIFINMKHLQLVDSKDKVWKLLQNNGLRIEVIGEMLEPLWEALPASVEMISVRYRKYDRVPRRGLTHKYYQKRSDRNGN